MVAPDETLAKQAGVLLGLSRTTDAVDAIVVATAVALRAAIVTSDVGDITNLSTPPTRRRGTGRADSRFLVSGRREAAPPGEDDRHRAEQGSIQATKADDEAGGLGWIGGPPGGRNSTQARTSG